MNADIANRSPYQPMSIGNIISTSWRIYTSNFLQYLLISLRATAWMLAPLLVALIGARWLYNQSATWADAGGLLGLLIPAWIVFFLYFAACSLGEIAGISRLTYWQLAGVSVDESDASAMDVQGSLRFTRSRKFALLGSAAIRNLIVALLNFVFLLIFSLLLALFVAGATSPQNLGSNINIGYVLLGALLAFALLVVFIWLSIWISVRLAMAEQAIAIETSGAIASIGRSWKLMKRNGLRAFATLLLAGLISLPVSLATSLLAENVGSSLFDLEAVLSQSPMPELFPIVTFVGLYLVTLSFATLANIVIVPFLKTVLTTIFFDVRNRYESADR